MDTHIYIHTRTPHTHTHTHTHTFTHTHTHTLMHTPHSHTHSCTCWQKSATTTSSDLYTTYCVYRSLVHHTYQYTPLSHDDSSLASQPYFSAWVARMRVKYCGGGKSTYNFHVPPTRKNTAGLRLLRDYDDRC